MAGFFTSRVVFGLLLAVLLAVLCAGCAGRSTVRVPTSKSLVNAIGSVDYVMRGDRCVFPVTLKDGSAWDLKVPDDFCRHSQVVAATTQQQEAAATAARAAQAPKPTPPPAAAAPAASPPTK